MAPVITCPKVMGSIFIILNNMPMGIRNNVAKREIIIVCKSVLIVTNRAEKNIKYGIKNGYGILFIRAIKIITDNISISG